MSAPTRDEVIRMAREAGTPDPMVFLAAYELLVAAAYARGVASESKRSDALAATIAELRDLVTTEGETKADFVARVRAVLGEDPDARVVRAVLAEREACANVCDGVYHQNIGPQYGEVRHGIAACAAAIRARKQP